MVKMYWLKEQDFRECRNGAFVGSANSTRQRWGCFSMEIQRANFFHIFGNNLKIRAVRPIKISDGTTPHGDLSYDTLFAKIRPAVLEEISGQNSQEERER